MNLHPLRLLALSGVALSACGGPSREPDAASDPVDTAAETGDVPAPGDDASDAGSDVPDVSVDADATPPDPPEEVICRPCDTAADCGGGGNQCLILPSGLTYCGFDCAADASACPAGSECVEVVDAIFQCLPETRRCVDPCDGVECAEGERCDADTGLCFVPRTLCAPCEDSEQCGGDADLCLTFRDIDNSRACARDCSTAPCPDGYLCAEVRGDGELFQQCIPEIQTCTDRCVDVTCPDEGDICDPRTGACAPPVGLCGSCTSNRECGGGNLCLGLPGAPCGSDTDCEREEFCDSDSGQCVGQFCGLDCAEDPSVCPAGAFCFGITGGGAQCLPMRLSCLDRCADVVCPAGQNCDDTTGDCVRSTLAACGAPCEVNAACGGYDDVCLSIDGGSPRCLYACGRDTAAPCPLGYECALLTNGTEFCVPISADLTCDACDIASCAGGEECNPVDGSCAPVPPRCASTGEACAGGEVCAFYEDRCEPVGLPCTYETRFTQCDFSSFVCTAPSVGRQGTCEQYCFGDASCPADRPRCASYHGMFGDICVADAPGGAHTCGALMTSADPVGQPCDVVFDPVDPTLCPSPDAPYCLDAVDPGARGFCTRSCRSDADCPNGGCADLATGRFCVPPPCACVAPIALAPGERDVLGGLLERLGISRCDLAWSTQDRRAGSGPATADDPFQLAATATLRREPLRALGFASAERAAIEAAGSGTALPALATAAAAWGLASPEPIGSLLLGSQPLADALNALADATGSPRISDDVRADAASLPDALEQAAGEIVVAIAVALDAHQSMIASWPGVELVAAGLIGAALDHDPGLDLADPEVRDRLTDPQRRVRLLELAVTVLTAVEEASGALGAIDLAATMRFETPIGDIILAGAGADVHDLSTPALLLIDVGGDDRYVGAAGANAGPAQPASIVLDLGGADTYTYDAIADPRDDGLLPSDGAGRAEPARLGDGRRSLSTTLRHGAGLFGVGALYDLGSGLDTFTTLRAGQGFGAFGVGVLVDDGGPARLELEAYGQGAGVFGVGVMSLGDAPHDAFAVHAAQGFGGVAGVGVLVGGTGSDRYVASAGDPATDTVLYANRVSTVDRNLSFAQGCGAGWSIALGAPLDAGGGLGLLVERGGDDVYEAGVAAQGFGAANGVGFLADHAGDDTYLPVDSSIGAGHRMGVGVLEERAGADAFGAEGRAPTRALGFGSDFGAGIAIDRSGDDVSHVSAFSAGYARLNGFALAADLAGADRYVTDAADAFGRAVLTILGTEPLANPRRGVSTIAIFVDAGGVDAYEGPDAAPAGDTLTWTWMSPEEARLPVFGGGVDGDGATGL